MNHTTLSDYFKDKLSVKGPVANTRSSRRAGIFNLHGAWEAGFASDGAMYIDRGLSECQTFAATDMVTWFVNDLLDYFQSCDTLSPLTKEPTVNKNIKELAKLRERIAELERMEANAHAVLLRELQGAVPHFNLDITDARNFAAAADALRDALEPFDSGVRAPSMPPPPVIGVPAPTVAGFYTGPQFREVWGKGVPFHWRNRGEMHWRQGNVEPTFHAAKEYRFSGSAPADLPPTVGES